LDGYTSADVEALHKMSDTVLPQTREVDEVSRQGRAELQHDKLPPPNVLLDGLQEPTNKILDQLDRILI
jgi:hypothetical protein